MPKIRHYYEAHDLSTDALLRCKDCRRLITTARIREKKGHCPHCGHRRYAQATGLTLWEWCKIRLGLLRFPHQEEFLKEFSAKESS